MKKSLSRMNAADRRAAHGKNMLSTVQLTGGYES